MNQKSRFISKLSFQEEIRELVNTMQEQMDVMYAGIERLENMVIIMMNPLKSLPAPTYYGGHQSRSGSRPQ